MLAGKGKLAGAGDADQQHKREFGEGDGQRMFL